MVIDNINDIEDMSPFGSKSLFLKAYEFEKKNGSGWLKQYIQLREQTRESKFQIKTAYPCMVGIYWLHYQAKLLGLSDSTIRKRMEHNSGIKVRDTFFRKISELFFDQPLHSQRAKRIIETRFSEDKFPRANLMYDYCFACSSLIFSDRVPGPNKKNRGRTPPERIFQNGRSAKNHVRLRIRKYAMERGVSWRGQELSDVTIYMENLVRALTLEIATNYNAAKIDLDGISPVEAALDECSRRLFPNSSAADFLNQSLQKELEWLRGIIAVGIAKNIAKSQSNAKN
jgi:hypothetical protein